MKDQIVQFLRSYNGYFSGEEISRRLKISRSAIWKNIEELRKEGYNIEAVPHLGYKLLSAPERLFPREITFNLPTKFIGRNIVYFDSVDSTMNEAFQLALRGASEGTLVVAEGQTKGKGRLGRNWTSPKGRSQSQ